ncbi:chemotaxis protein CheB [Spirosoma linguale]|uniref:protein-glutamate methylesterase n=1 Tax=Spirosoma linguale (strain ATCC 33905 / DSM 74 / LMG 10896 / Claus 1) TaxID=504472 RepID=D2QJ69_SPILD|nr:CheB methylesterase [Spirosoma linguale DSM 74]
MAETKLKNPTEAILIGGSTGSIEVLLRVLPALTTPLSFALIIVLHRKNTADSTLANLLSLKTDSPFREVDDKDPIRPGTIYLAPADYHLLIEQDKSFSLDDSEKVNYSRPSIDVTFESAADVYRSSLIGILLSGANADGTKGMQAIQKTGGLLVAQHPDTALVGFMPQQAIANTTIDYVLDIDGLIEFLKSVNTSQQTNHEAR